MDSTTTPPYSLNTFAGTPIGSLGQGTDLGDNDMLVLLLLVPIRVEDAVHDGIHRRVGAREKEQDLLHQVAHRLGTVPVENVPVRKASRP